MDNEVRAAERVAKARSELILDHTFYGVLISQVEPVLSRRVPTAATNGKTHYWNPDFVATLTQDELLTVQRHESEHDGRRHHTRRNGRDPDEWNKATDYAINIDLQDEGCVLPVGALVDPKYRGWSAEDIYRARELDREREEQQRQQQQPQPQDGDDDEGDAGNGQADDDEADDQSDGDDEADGQDGGENADEGGGESDDESDGSGQGEQDSAELGDGDGEQEADGSPEAADGQAAGEPQDDANGGGGENSQADGEDDASGHGQGDGEGDNADADGQGQGGEGGGDGEDETGDGQRPIAGSADPGGMGAVLDAAEDAADLSEADAKWERVLRQAASLAAKRGTAPGHVTREIERADKPPQDWRETLRAWFDHGATSVETWNRPNRRFVGAGLYLPGRQKDGINRVVFLIDTSGSMDKIALECIAVETQAALDENIIDEVVIVYGDTRVTRVDTYRSGDEIEFDPRGGGGTELLPLFNYVRDEIEDPSLVVAFTDGFIDNVAADDPPCDVLWAYTGYPDHVKQHMANTPWNAPAIDVGSH